LDFIWTWILNISTFLDKGWTWTEFQKLGAGSGSENMTVRSSTVSVYACCAIVCWFCSHDFLWLSL